MYTCICSLTYIPIKVSLYKYNILILRTCHSVMAAYSYKGVEYELWPFR